MSTTGRWLKLAGPFLLWLFCFRDIITQDIPVNMDTHTIYGVIKYYFNNMANGDVPLWNPFVVNGAPFYAIAIVNLFNPVTHLVLIGHWLGIGYYGGFIAYLCVYVFIGGIGFYALARLILQDRLLAYTGYLMYLFSGITASVFVQLTILELFVPAVWFMYFLLKLEREWKRSDCVGLTLAAMVLVISYVPFYFMTAFGIFAIIVAVTYPRRTAGYIGDAISFGRKNGRLVAACLLFAAVACVPLVAYKWVDSTGEIVSPSRHCANTTAEECYAHTMHEQGGMLYEETSRSGGLGERVDLGYLFAHHDKISYGADSMFFLPVWIYVVILLSCLVRVTRPALVLLATGFLIMLVGLADVTPLHRWLYDHLAYFRYFRNLFFFMAYLMPLIILLGLYQLKQFLAIPINTWTAKKAVLIWAVLVHGGVALWWINLGDVTAGSYAVLAVSLAMVCLYGAGFLKTSSSFWTTGFIIATLIHPLEAFAHYTKNARSFTCDLPSFHANPEFAYVRSGEDKKSGCKIYNFVPYTEFWHTMAMTDSSGYVGYPTSVTRWVFHVSQWMPEDIFKEYVSHKFIAYDAVQPLEDRPQDVLIMAEAFKRKLNVAFIAADDEQSLLTAKMFSRSDEPALPISGADGPLEVTEFSVDRIQLRTVFPEAKFLVFNDAYTQFWKVFVNGREEHIFRSNGAFKGVVLPKGENTVVFRYRPPVGGWVYVAVALAFAGFSGFTIWFFIRERNWPWHDDVGMAV